MAPCQLDGPQRNEADGFALNLVRAVQKRPGNQPPVLAQITDTRVLAGGEIALNITAADPDGDPVVFFAQELNTLTIPKGATIADHRDGSATLDWPTRLEDVGVHRLRIAAFDEGGGEVVHDMAIAICNRIDDDASDSGVIRALFEPGPPAPCTAADRNHDGVVSAADSLTVR